MDKRVEVAKDVIEHLDVLKVAEGVYCTNPAIKGKERGNVQPLIDKVSNGCHVCALGGMFLSLIRLYDKVDFKDCHINISFNSRPDFEFQVYSEFIKTKLKEEAGFSSVQIRDIEFAFEGWFGHDYYYNNYENPSERLKAIMKNIVANKGDFSPTGGLLKKKKKSSTKV